nr:MAG TPA: hypothetical protein [Caudoviricetes sp.]
MFISLLSPNNELIILLNKPPYISVACKKSLCNINLGISTAFYNFFIKKLLT